MPPAPIVLGAPDDSPPVEALVTTREITGLRRGTVVVVTGDAVAGYLTTGHLRAMVPAPVP